MRFDSSDKLRNGIGDTAKHLYYNPSLTAILSLEGSTARIQKLTALVIMVVSTVVAKSQVSHLSHI